MKHMAFSMILSVGFLFYLSSLGHREVTTPSPLPQVAPQVANLPSEENDEAPAPEVDTRMVQIQGKWYPYRADNKYMIDGVPTFHLPSKIKDVEPVAQMTPPAQPAAAVAVPSNLQKSQKLIQMASDNPISVYTPDGFRALQEGIEAAKETAAERRNILEALSHEP